MIDTHCHLTDERLGKDLEGVLQRAHDAGVSRVVSVSVDLDDSRAAIEVCRARPDVRCAVGVHPNNSGPVSVEQIAQLEKLQAHPAVVALGEMGLDYHWQDVPRDHQAGIFQAQLDVAGRLGRPVIIHCREAVDDCLAIMKAFPSVPAVFHCFTGTADEARRILDRGYLIGFTGVVTFKKSDELREVARFTPLDRLLLETDAPYLSPEPVRGRKVNEPALVVHTAVAVARARGMELAALDEATTQNALRFYRWDLGS
jgi:TatD DNase family protein